MMQSMLRDTMEEGSPSSFDELAGCLNIDKGADAATGSTARSRPRVRRPAAAAQASTVQHQPTAEEVTKADEAAAALIEDEQAAKVKQSKRSAKMKKKWQQLQPPGQEPASSSQPAKPVQHATMTSVASSAVAGDGVILSTLAIDILVSIPVCSSQQETPSSCDDRCH